MHYLTQKSGLFSAQNGSLVTVLVVILLILLPSHSEAQEPNMLQKVQSLKTPSARNKITVYYSSGYKKKAIEVRSIIEGAMKFYEKELGAKVELSLAVLTKPQYEEMTKGLPSAPYGMPWVSSSPHIAFLPATSDGVISTDLLGVKKTLSPAILNEINSSGYSYEEAAAKLVDLIGLHELGHTYALAYGIRPVNLWFNEFLATYFAYTYLAQTHPKLAKLYDATHEVYGKAFSPKHTSLEDFERLYNQVGPQNYGWYQATFLEQVRQVHKARALSFLVDARKAFPSDEKNPVGLNEALQRLEKIDAGFVGWAERLKNK